MSASVVITYDIARHVTNSSASVMQLYYLSILVVCYALIESEN